ncbi:MAG TPA: hypothetical protein VKW77_05190, partial [Acidimicrobiales bacterium]|nr:hypothetical protein [Acidimicrobiales bacterium]
ADRLAALVRLADLLVRESGMGVEPVEPIEGELLDAVGVGGDPRARLQPLLHAVNRRDGGAAESKPAAPESGDVALVLALDGSTG